MPQANTNYNPSLFPGHLFPAVLVYVKGKEMCTQLTFELFQGRYDMTRVFLRKNNSTQ